MTKVEKARIKAAVVSALEGQEKYSKQLEIVLNRNNIEFLSIANVGLKEINQLKGTKDLDQALAYKDRYTFYSGKYLALMDVYPR